MYEIAVERHPGRPSMPLSRLMRLLAICLLVFRATFASAQTPPIATVGLTAGWATFGQAVPQGLAPRRPAVGTLPTQTDVKNRWPDGSIRFAIVTAACRLPATLPAGRRLRPRVAPSRRQRPDASVKLQIGATAYTATLPAATVDRRLALRPVGARRPPRRHAGLGDRRGASVPPRELRPRACSTTASRASTCRSRTCWTRPGPRP